MSVSAIVRTVTGKKLEARSRQHRVVTDRPPDEGGSDEGCTSGELLLMAVGSCATGSLRNYLQAQQLPTAGLQTELAFAPSAVAGARDKMVLVVTVPAGLDRCSDEALCAAATSGRVVSRLKLGSEVEVRIQRPVGG